MHGDFKDPGGGMDLLPGTHWGCCMKELIGLTSRAPNTGILWKGGAEIKCQRFLVLLLYMSHMNLMRDYTT